MNIGDKISELRKLNKLTQKELAEKINVSDKVISKWETNKSLPDVETIPKLAKEFGVSISELYECIEEKTTTMTEDYNEERIWQYKKYSIASYFLVLISPVLFFLQAVNWTNYYYLEDIINFLLMMASIASCLLGNFFQISQFVRLYGYSKSKYYREKYTKALKKYGMIFLACHGLIITFFLVLLLIASLLRY